MTNIAKLEEDALAPWNATHWVIGRKRTTIWIPRRISIALNCTIGKRWRGSSEHTEDYSLFTYRLLEAEEHFH